MRKYGKVWESSAAQTQHSPGWWQQPPTHNIVPVGGNTPKNSQIFSNLPNISHKSRQLSHRPRASGVVQRSRAYAANPQPPGLASTHLVVVFPEEFFVIVQRYIFYRSGYIVPDFPLIKLSGYVQSYQAVGAAYRGFIAL